MSWSLERVKGIAYALVSSSTFGLIPMFAIPPMREGMLVNSVVFYRFLFSSLAVGAVLLLRGSSLRVNRRELRFLIVLGLLYAATSLVLTSSYVYIPSGTATTIHFLYPVVVSVVMSLVFKERASVFPHRDDAGSLGRKRNSFDLHPAYIRKFCRFTGDVTDRFDPLFRILLRKAVPGIPDPALCLAPEGRMPFFIVDNTSYA